MATNRLVGRHSALAENPKSLMQGRGDSLKIATGRRQAGPILPEITPPSLYFLAVCAGLERDVPYA
jgi:hypothetical protein